ncbi:MAG: sulfatase-like hydrolase/transferase, partial [Acidiferrobacterales bacterium]
GLLMGFGAILGEVGYRRYAVLIAAIGLLLWLQGNGLVWEYGLLDGHVIDWTHGMWRGWVDAGIWVAAIFAAIRFYRVVERPIIYLAASVFSLQLILLVSTGIQEADALQDKSDIRHSADTLGGILRFAPEKNVLHIVLDGFQSDIFETITGDKIEGERYRSALQGFVFYKENMGVFASTMTAVPALLSGQIYHNHIPKRAYIETVIGGKTILNSAFKAGYEVDIVGEQYMVGSVYAKGHYTNAYMIPNSYGYHTTEKGYELGDAAQLLDLTLFRLVPHFLKKYIHNEYLGVVQPLINDADYLKVWYFSHSAFLHNLAKNMSVGRTGPVYKYFHLMNAHSPQVVDGRCNYVGGVLPRNRQTVTVQSKCSLDAVIKVLEKMKALGIYDDSLIILMADHGAGIDPYDLKPAVTENGDNAVAIPPLIVSMATPLMAIKAPGVSGPLQISTAPASLIDTAATVNAILGLGDVFAGRSILELRPDERRVRGYYFHAWRRKDFSSDYVGPIQEYIVEGSVYDSAAWRKGVRFLAPTEQAKAAISGTDATSTP